MYLVRVGWRTINLEYLIEAADSELGAPPDEAPPGGIRAAIYPGKLFDVGGDDAARLRLHIADNLKPLPGEDSRNHRPPARPEGAKMRPGILAPPSPEKSSSKEE